MNRGLFSEVRRIKKILKQQKEGKNEKDQKFYLVSLAEIYKSIADKYALLQNYYLRKSLSVLRESILLDKKFHVPCLMLGTHYNDIKNYKSSKEYLELAHDILVKNCKALYEYKKQNGSVDQSTYDFFVKDYIFCTTSLSVVYSAIGEFDKAKAIDVEALILIQDDADRIISEYEVLTSSLISQIIGVLGLSFNYKELADFFNSDLFIFYFPKLNLKSSVGNSIKLKTVVAKLPHSILATRKNNIIESWRKDFWKNIWAVDTINKSKALWRRINEEPIPITLLGEFQDVLNAIKERLLTRKEVSEKLFKESKEAKNNFETIFNSLSDQDLARSSKDIMEMGDTLDSIYELTSTMIDQIINNLNDEIKNIQKIPFRFRIGFYSLNVSRNFLRIFFLVFFLGTLIPSLLNSESVKISFFIGLGLFIISEVVVDPWIKKIFIPSYKRLLYNYFSHLNSNIQILYYHFNERLSRLL